MQCLPRPLGFHALRAMVCVRHLPPDPEFASSLKSRQNTPRPKAALGASEKQCREAAGAEPKVWSGRPDFADKTSTPLNLTLSEDQ